jgi:hypothetical protein
VENLWGSQFFFKFSIDPIYRTLIIVKNPGSSHHLLPAMLVLLIFTFPSNAQDKTLVDGKDFTKYKRKYFSPHRGIFYSLYVSPVLTVDPLGLGGKSTYGVAAGVRINLWESKAPEVKLSGLRVKGLYWATGYEYYPRQYNKIYTSLWLRIKTFIPIAARTDWIYGYGYGLRGMAQRFCFGVEIKKITLFLCGETFTYYSKVLGYPPETKSPYTNAGAIMLVIPIVNRLDR